MNYLQLCELFYFRIYHIPASICAVVHILLQIETDP